MHINNQVALISGGGSGMGAATAQHLAKLGAKVAILDQNGDNAKKIGEITGGVAIQCDVTRADETEQAFTQVGKLMGFPRIVVNCAGICPAELIVDKEANAMELQNFYQVIQVNLLGSFNVLRLAAAHMSKLELLQDNERGVIINTSSIAAEEGQIGQVAYSASKGGVSAMTLPAARELARFGVRVMTIAPGIIETPMLHGLPEKVRENLIAHVPFPKRFGKATEYAQLVQHIVENVLLNGAVIRLDGALRMQAR
jgi:NAD(P)-dependent dehydrogenase (short-subunit alcohol dehydrogenase family)